ncbi:hypothetical protein H6F96_15145 [Microcoleus sp. FACHB-53]|nr:hypothetical protein [Microcoleus sp. FACHB-53]
MSHRTPCQPPVREIEKRDREAQLQAADRTPFLNELPESVRFSQATLPQLQWHEQPGEYWLSIGYRSNRKQRLSDNIRC